MVTIKSVLLYGKIQEDFRNYQVKFLFLIVILIGDFNLEFI
jgi:hypothetical protein